MASIAALDIATLGGMAGAAIMIVAYFLNQLGWLASDDWRFPLANLVGAVLIMISLFVEWNLPSVVIEGFWIAISLFGVAKYARARRSG